MSDGRSEPGGTVSEAAGGLGHDFRVVRGEPTAEELAAIVMVLRVKLAAASSATGRQSAPPAWTDRAAMLRRPVYAGPGAWRRSGLP